MPIDEGWEQILVPQEPALIALLRRLEQKSHSRFVPFVLHAIQSASLALEADLFRFAQADPTRKDIVVETFDEAEALRAESKLIARHNNPILTNLMLHKQLATKREVEYDSGTFRGLRCMAGLTVQALASEAGVSLSTVNRMEYGTAEVTRRIAYQVLNVMSAKIGRRITIEEVEGLQAKS